MRRFANRTPIRESQRSWLTYGALFPSVYIRIKIVPRKSKLPTAFVIITASQFKNLDYTS